MNCRKMNKIDVGFEIFAAVAMKSAILWHVRISELGTTLAVTSRNKTNSVAIKSASKLYRLIDRHLLVKFSANICI
jgi:Trk K+ transport system NAD-binding subunit